MDSDSSGWMAFLFNSFLALIGGVLSFDFQLIKRYMRWVVLISAAFVLGAVFF